MSNKIDIHGPSKWEIRKAYGEWLNGMAWDYFTVFTYAFPPSPSKAIEDLKRSINEGGKDKHLQLNSLRKTRANLDIPRAQKKWREFHGKTNKLGKPIEPADLKVSANIQPYDASRGRSIYILKEGVELHLSDNTKG